MKILSVLSAFICLMSSLNAAADPFIVDFGLAKNFLVFDVDYSADQRLLFKTGGTYNGNIARWWTDGGLRSDDEFVLEAGATINGNIYLEGEVGITLDGTLNGSLLQNQLLNLHYADLKSAISNIQSFASNATLNAGTILADAGGITIADVGDMRNITLTLSGDANDVFYIRTDDHFEFTGTAPIILDGVDSANVVFLYTGTHRLKLQDVGYAGTFISTETAIEIKDITFFSGSLYSGAGVTVDTGGAEVVFDQVAPIPEPAVVSLISLFGGGMIFWNRISKKLKKDSPGKVSDSSSHIAPF